MAYLEVVSGPGKRLKYRLADDRTTIGRHPECQIVLEQVGQVSRKHAEILRQGDDFYVKDLGSRNGTFHNDEKIDETPRLLNDSDMVRICDAEFVFHCVSSELDKPIGRTIVLPDKTPALNVVLVDDEQDETDLSDSSSNVVVTAKSGAVLGSAVSLESRMTALVEITQSLGKVLALNNVLPKVLESLLKIFRQADRGFIVLQTETGELDPRWHLARTHTGEDTVRISRTIVKRVMESNEAILTADATQDERLDQSKSISELKIRSMMCAPLVDSEGVSFGVIQVDTVDQGEPFQAEDLNVLTSVAVQAGIAIDNARMHEGVLRQKEMEQDLALAREIQTSFLPQCGPPVEGYEFFDYYHPANHVGGDYFDYIRLPDDRVAIVVADVVGHGVAAAMMMAKLSGEVTSHLEGEDDPATAAARLNDRLVTRRIERFVTLLMCVLDPIKHELTIVSAGHMPPICRRTDGGIEEPGKKLPGLPRGIQAGNDYPQTTISLERGEWLLMYTDGVSDAMSPVGKRFTIERMRTHVRNDEDAKTVFNGIVKDVEQFIGDRPRVDDMCLVCLRRI